MKAVYGSLFQKPTSAQRRASHTNNNKKMKKRPKQKKKKRNTIDGGGAETEGNKGRKVFTFFFKSETKDFFSGK